MKWVIASLAAVAVGALGSVNAQGVSEIVVTGSKAPNGSEVRSKVVSYADLDLAKSAGLTTLLSRIRGAASDVCSPEPQGKDPKDSGDYKKCVARAVNMAITKVNNPGLTAMGAGAAH